MIEADALTKPDFLTDRHLTLSVDTSGYCQARCQMCVWPELKNARRIMSRDEFGLLLDRFAGYSFEEFGFNSINEPFVDKGILDKVSMLIDSGLKVRSLFFSSNWLIPDEANIERFASLVRRAVDSENISWVNLNATVSGIDHRTYDELQAGSSLKGVVAPYRELDFDRAKANVCRLAGALSEALPLKARTRLHVKAYGDLFSEEAYNDFWTQTLKEGGVDEAFIQAHVKMMLNHAFQTFGRADAAQGNRRRRCASQWLNKMLVVGPDGHVGLCCIEGAHRVNIGNLFETSVEDVVASEPFQASLKVVTGQADPEPSDICMNCEFFV